MIVSFATKLAFINACFHTLDKMPTLVSKGVALLWNMNTVYSLYTAVQLGGIESRVFGRSWYADVREKIIFTIYIVLF